MHSKYNGKDFCFDIYSHKVDCVYSAWNEDGTKNPFYEFKSIQVKVGEEIKMVNEPIQNEKGEWVSNMVERKVPIYEPYKAYYKPTTDKNSVTITVDVKKHNKNQYFDAVKSQLMYLKDDIDFIERTEGSEVERPIEFKASILYEDENVIIPNQGYYSRPHFVIKGIAYGLIDYNEADLSNKYANIGIKVKMEDVSVTPNRESVIYNSKTRNTIITTDKIVGEEIEKRIQKSLNQTDFIDWLRACNTIMFNNSNTDPILSRMSQLVDKSTIKPKFNKNVVFSSQTKTMFGSLINVQSVDLISKYNSTLRKNVTTAKRTDQPSILGFDKPVFYGFCPSNGRTTSYLASLNKDGFTIIRAMPAYDYLNPIYIDFTEGNIDLKTALEKGTNLIKENVEDVEKIKILVKQFNEGLIVLNEVRNSKQIRNYQDVVVPEGFKASSDDDTEDEDDVLTEVDSDLIRKEKYKETLKLRKANKAFVINKLANKNQSSYYFKIGFTRAEIKFSELDFENTDIVYGHEDSTELLESLAQTKKQVSDISGIEAYEFFWNDEVKMMKVAKTNAKYFKEAIKVEDYVLGIKKGIVKSTTMFRDIFTANFINDKVHGKCMFLKNFKNFSNESAKENKELKKYLRSNKLDLTTNFNNIKELFLLKQLYYAQIKFLKNPDLNESEKQEIIDNAIKTAGCEDLDLDITDVSLIDIKRVKQAEKYDDLDDVYGSILNYITPLTQDVQKDLPYNLETEIRAIIESRKDQLSYEFQGINK